MCVFCDESRDPRSAIRFLGSGWPFADRMIYSGRWIVAVPGYGPQVYPYLLIFSRRHIFSMAQTNRWERAEILDLLEQLCGHREFLKGGLFVFEHGGCSPLESCMEHFHLHVVSSRYSLLRALAPYPYREVTVSESIILSAAERYLFAAEFQGGREIRGLLASSSDIRSQYFRRALAEMLGEKDWDWRLGQNTSWMRKAMEEFRSSILSPVPVEHQTQSS